MGEVSLNFISYNHMLWVVMSCVFSQCSLTLLGDIMFANYFFSRSVLLGVYFSVCESVHRRAVGRTYVEDRGTCKQALSEKKKFGVKLTQIFVD